MDPLTMMAIGSGLGLTKHFLVDQPREQKHREIRAAEMVASPWTRMAPQQQIKEADPFGNMLQFGAAGATMGQNVELLELAKANSKLGRTTPINVSMGSFWGAPNYAAATSSPWSLY